MRLWDALPLAINLWAVVPQVVMWGAASLPGYMAYKLGKKIVLNCKKKRHLK